MAKTEREGWHPRSALLLLVALFGAWVSWALVTQAGPWDGTRIGGTVYPQSDWRGGVVLHTVVSPSTTLLKKGDQVVAIDDQPLETWMTNNRGHHFEVGDRLSYQVLRDGELRDVPVVLEDYSWWGALKRSLPAVMVELGLLALASYVVLVRGRDPAARVLFAIAAVIPFGFPSWPLKGQVLDLAQSPWPLWPQLVSACVWALVWGAMIPHFAMVFPSSPPLLSRRRWILPALYALPFLVHGAYVTATLPPADDRLERLERLSTVWLTSQRYAPVLVIAALAWAYWRTRGTEDQQRVSLVAASLLVAFAVNLIGVQLPILVTGEPVIPYPYWEWVFLVVPLAIAVAILRHRLFDITVVLRRSLTAAAVGGLVGGGYVVFLLVLGHPTRAELPYFLVGTTAALLMPPLYQRLRRRIDRQIYGARANPYELVEQIVKLDPDEPESMLRRLTATLSEALHLPFVAITLSERGRVLRAEHGVAQGTPTKIRLTRGTEDVGHLELDVGLGREPFGRSDRRLLAAIATHAAATVHATTLNLDLMEARTRLVSGREEERRRVRRDLHDGVGPTLALLAMNLEVIKELVPVDPEAAVRLLDEAGARTHEAISEVRRTVSDLRPAVLDELGLEGAVRILAERTSAAHRLDRGGTLEVLVDVDPDARLTRLPAAAEVAAYRIVSEAVNNVSRHANAGVCSVRIALEDQLEIVVDDDGTGIARSAPHGTGLASIHERAAELGGHTRIENRPGGGTRVAATLPCPPWSER